MVNKVILVGNVGADPEVRHINENTQVANFTLATSESYKNKEGERVTNTEWHNIAVWNGLSKVVENYIKKGMTVYIEGKIETKKYEKDGVVRYNTTIKATELKMIGKKGDQTSNYESVKPHQVPNATDNIIPDDGNDLPF